MLIKRYNQRGFAIGVILLAVVLIAAIVSAIAISSRGSMTSAEREKAVIAAASMLNLYTELMTRIDREIATGTTVTDNTSLGYIVGGNDYITDPRISYEPGVAYFGPRLSGQIGINVMINNPAIRTFYVLDVRKELCDIINLQSYGVARARILNSENASESNTNGGGGGIAETLPSTTVYFDNGVTRLDTIYQGLATNHILPSTINNTNLATIPMNVTPVFSGVPICLRYNFFSTRPDSAQRTLYVVKY